MYIFLLKEVPYHLGVSFEWIVYKILCGIVALDLVLNEIFFMVKKQFSSKKIELETLLIKYILLKKYFGFTFICGEDLNCSWLESS